MKCKNKDQRNELSKHLEDIGFKYIESEKFDLYGYYDSGHQCRLQQK
ncbi:putative transcriptional regulator [Acinetobacter phage Ab69]|nr:putative transcriptional regulator [Acinetobacter phage Ab69]